MMSNTKHTPEPWLLDERGGCIAIYDGEHINCLGIDKINFIAYWSGFRDGDRWNVHAKDSANAARIVACVNACAGMDDPSAEIERLRAKVEEHKLTLHKVLKRVDELEDVIANGMRENANLRQCIAEFRDALDDLDEFDSMSFCATCNTHTVNYDAKPRCRECKARNAISAAIAKANEVLKCGK